MSFNKLFLFFGLWLTLAGCASERFTGNTDNQYTKKSSSPTEMGMRYLIGRGVPVNEERAFSYFKKGAEDGDPFAINELAYLYATGKGTIRDDTLAFIYYKQAANAGLASAQYNLGLFYFYGRGTGINRDAAIMWFTKAADSGFLPAEVALKRYQAS